MRALKSKLQTAMMERSIRALAARFAGRDGIAVSILCPSRNHASYLDLSLASLQDQTLPSRYYEVVVADNASFDDTSEVLRCYREKKILSLEILSFEREQGIGRTWRHLFEAARGEILLLWDDAMIAFPDLLAHHLIAHLEGEALICGGSCPHVISHLIPSGNALNTRIDLYALANGHDEWRELLRPFVFAHESEMQGKELPVPSWLDFDTTHASLRRQTLFDNGTFLSGENIRDVGQWGLLPREFALRAVKNGVPLKFLGGRYAWQQVKPVEYVDLRETERHINRFLTTHAELEPVATQAALRAQLLPLAEPFLTV